MTTRTHSASTPGRLRVHATIRGRVARLFSRGRIDNVTGRDRAFSVCRSSGFGIVEQWKVTGKVRGVQAQGLSQRAAVL
jgi:hypothetical protein